MNNNKFLLFNWKHKTDLNLANSITKFDPFQNQTFWNFFLLCNHELWSFFKPHHQFKIIAQNFNKLSFSVYLQAVKIGFENNHLRGVLLNHFEINNSSFEINQLIDLANRFHKKIFFCLGKFVNFNASFNINSKILMREIIALKSRILNPKNLVLIFEPLFLHDQNTLLFKNSQLIMRTILFIKRFAKVIFNHQIAVLYGGGVNPFNYAKLPHIDGFIVGKASLNWDQILKWSLIGKNVKKIF